MIWNENVIQTLKGTIILAGKKHKDVPAEKVVQALDELLRLKEENKKLHRKLEGRDAAN